jgi:hypothetical protein
MKNKFGIGAVVIVALVWAGALCYFNGQFQSELRNGSATLSSPGYFAPLAPAELEPDNAALARPHLEADSSQINPANTTQDTSDPASEEGHLSVASCAQLLASIEAEAEPETKSAAADRAARAVSWRDLPEVLNWLKSKPGSDSAELRSRLIGRWAVQDPQSAASWATQLPDDSLSRATVVLVAVAWANSDLSAAVGWVNALPEGGGKQAAVLSLANEAARADPLTALGLVVTLPPSAERDDSLVHGVSQWADAEPSAAIAWAEKVPDPNLRQRLLGAAAIAAAYQNGPMAAGLVTSGLLQGVEQDRALVSVVQRWAQRSPVAAAAWVAQFPETPARNTAVQHLVSIWAQQDSAAAQSWLGHLPEGSLRNTASAAYAQVASRL